ncbi:12203_t:CDS:2 [Ambispora leptoticha]|uniref:12203_t:CDS:1 n=1 Tax=Ambispora leptoticha TaxID=144679 RepID=A0A9N9DPC9_9GLOM|nr:12203_t:CDS:2 [Ambispora leptoticha]
MNSTATTLFASCRQDSNDSRAGYYVSNSNHAFASCRQDGNWNLVGNSNHAINNAVESGEMHNHVISSAEASRNIFSSSYHRRHRSRKLKKKSPAPEASDNAVNFDADNESDAANQSIARTWVTNADSDQEDEGDTMKKNQGIYYIKQEDDNALLHSADHYQEDKALLGTAFILMNLSMAPTATTDPYYLPKQEIEDQKVYSILRREASTTTIKEYHDYIHGSSPLLGQSLYNNNALEVDNDMRRDLETDHQTNQSESSEGAEESDQDSDVSSSTQKWSSRLRPRNQKCLKEVSSASEEERFLKTPRKRKYNRKIKEPDFPYNPKKPYQKTSSSLSSCLSDQSSSSNDEEGGDSNNTDQAKPQKKKKEILLHWVQPYRLRTCTPMTFPELKLIDEFLYYYRNHVRGLKRNWSTLVWEEIHALGDGDEPMKFSRHLFQDVLRRERFPKSPSAIKAIKKWIKLQKHYIAATAAQNENNEQPQQEQQSSAEENIEKERGRITKRR